MQTVGLAWIPRSASPPPSLPLCPRKWHRLSSTREALTSPWGAGGWGFRPRPTCGSVPRPGPRALPFWERSRPARPGSSQSTQNYWESLDHLTSGSSGASHSVGMPDTGRRLPFCDGPLTVAPGRGERPVKDAVPSRAHDIDHFIFISFSSSLRMSSVRLGTTLIKLISRWRNGSRTACVQILPLTLTSLSFRFFPHL